MSKVTSENNKLKQTLENPKLIILSTIITLIGLIVDLSNILSDNTMLSSILKCLIIIMLIYIIFAAFMYSKKISEYTIIKEKVELLEKLVHDGQKITCNVVTIYIFPQTKSYKFVFRKEYTIISDSTAKFFTGQFYCNKFLGKDKETKEKAKEFYKNNPIKWNDLKFYANLRYKQPDNTRFSSTVKLEVEPVADNANHIPYRIYYKEQNNGVAIPTMQGTEIELEYGYEVSAEYWGSYLNRTLSYFKEDAKVIIEYPDEGKLLDIKLCTLNKDDEPEDISEKCEKIEPYGSSQKRHEFILPKKKQKYRVHWVTESIFEDIPTTENLGDGLEVTDH